MTTTPRIPKNVFWRVAATSGLGELAQGVADVALPLIAVGALGATGWQASAVTAAESVGLVFFGLFAGVVADRYNRVSIITTANVLRAVAFLVLPIGGLFHVVSIPMLIILGVIAGAFGIFADTAAQALTPHHRFRGRIVGAQRPAARRGLGDPNRGPCARRSDDPMAR